MTLNLYQIQVCMFIMPIKFCLNIVVGYVVFCSFGEPLLIMEIKSVAQNRF